MYCLFFIFDEIDVLLLFLDVLYAIIYCAYMRYNYIF